MVSNRDQVVFFFRVLSQFSQHISKQAILFCWFVGPLLSLVNSPYIYGSVFELSCFVSSICLFMHQNPIKSMAVSMSWYLERQIFPPCSSFLENVIYLVLAARGLCCCVLAFSSCCERAALPCSARRSHCGGISCCSVWAVACSGFSSWGSWALEHSLYSCGTGA